MQVFHTVSALQTYLQQVTGQAAGNHTVGLVPTMGALHAGHLSLIKRSRQENDIVIVSIFVNPLQFAPNEDLEAYPRPQEEDAQLCKTAGVDAIFMPPPQELYGTPQPDLSIVTQVVPPRDMVNTLCGHSRPTHFQGVATVVTKLLNITRPTRAYFGQKDAQQVAIIQRLRSDLHLPGDIVICPIVREPDGLALSSRNRYLSARGRRQATILYRSLSAAQKAFAHGEKSSEKLLKTARAVFDTEPNVQLDYLVLVHPDTLKPLRVVEQVGLLAIAAYIGGNTTQAEPTSSDEPDAITANNTDQIARLLDNIILSTSTQSPQSATFPIRPIAEQATEQTAEQLMRRAAIKTRRPIIAIDGPAGAGKSTVARQLAHQLGLLYIDTGAMYRALTWYVLNQNVDPAEADAVAQLLPSCHIQLIANFKNDQPQPPRVTVNGEDVTQAIRSATVTAQVSTIAAQAAVRKKLVEQQQQYGQQGGIVADGRDIGTHVFPNAELKIYLTASVDERAQRRYQDLKSAQTITPTLSLPTLETLTQAIAERDYKDSNRAVSPLQKAEDALEIVTDDLSVEQVITQIANLYQRL